MPNNATRDDVQRLMKDEGGQLVDVLPQTEYQEEHLEGAINIPLKKLTRQTTSGLDKNRPIIVYCHDLL